MTVYATTAAMNIPKMLKITLPITIKEHFLWDRLPCLKMFQEYMSRQTSINLILLDISFDQQSQHVGLQYAE